MSTMEQLSNAGAIICFRSPAIRVILQDALASRFAGRFAPLKYQISFKPRARKDLKALTVKNQRRVLERIEALSDDLAGDVKKLTNFTPEYRMRAGDYRILFQVESATIIVFRVVHRRDAYR